MNNNEGFECTLGNRTFIINYLNFLITFNIY